MPILVVCAHPDLPGSHLNAPLMRAAAGLADVTVIDLYGRYPDFFIDVTAEQQLLLAHDTIVLQHPLHWYSVPSMLKHWIDQVLEQGWAYGPGGTRLQGKRWGHAISTGGDAQGYRADGLHQRSLAEFLPPLERTATLCGMHWLPPFVTYGADRLDDAGRAAAARRYTEWLGDLLQPAKES